MPDHAIVRLPMTEPPSGEVEVTLRSASWQPPLDALDDVPIHADTASLRWTLGDQSLRLAAVNLRGEELDLTAQGLDGVAERLAGGTYVRTSRAIEPTERILTPCPRRNWS